MIPAYVAWIGLGAGLLAAVVTDVREGKIPNALTVPLWGVGLLVGGLSLGPFEAIAGFAAAFAIHFPLWALNVQKGGDAKLFMAVGAFLGPETVVEATLWQWVLNIPVGLAVLAAMGRLGNLIQTLLWLQAKRSGKDPGPQPTPTMMIFAPVIAAAVGMALATDWLAFL